MAIVFLQDRKFKRGFTLEVHDDPRPPAAFERTMLSGRKGVVRFCAVYATRVFADSSPRVVTIRPGTLDDTRWLVPAAQNFMRSALAWACVDEVPGFDTQPEAFEEISRLWRQQGIVFENR